MIEERKGGEGNREADRRYREGVKETVDKTSEDERSRKARDVGREELDKARLKNLGYSSDEDSDIAVQAFCGYYGIEDDAVVSKLDDVFRTKVLNS